MTSYEKVLMEYYDMDDDYTRRTMLSLNEENQSNQISSLTSKLYQSIIDKVDDIDFGSIPESKGDITVVQNYDKLIECIAVINSLLTEYQQDTKIVGTIQTAIQNVEDRKDTFMKAFTFKLDLPITMYNTIVLSIFSATSLIIETSIDFIKDAGTMDFSIKFDKVGYVKNKNHVLFTNLERFNRAAANGELDKCLDTIMKQGSKQLLGVDDTLGIVSVMAAIGILVTIIPLMRELIFFFFNTKQQLSDWCGIQADLIYMNSELVKGNTILDKTDKERREISRKQANIASKFRKASNKLAVDHKTAEAKSKKQLKDEEKKYKVRPKEDIKPTTTEDETPISVSSTDNSSSTTSSIF